MSLSWERINGKMIRQIQRLLIENKQLLFYFWALTLFQAHYVSYRIKYRKPFNKRLEAFQTEWFEALKLTNDQSILSLGDQMNLYSARLAAKLIDRILTIKISNNRVMKNEQNNKFLLSIIIKDPEREVLFRLDSFKNFSDNYSVEEEIEFPTYRKDQFDNSIEILIDNQIVLEINQCEISGFAGYTSKLSNFKNESEKISVQIQLNWTLSTKSLLKNWLWNPSYFVPHLASYLLNMNRFYIYFYRPILLCATDSFDDVVWRATYLRSMFKLLPKIQLINGEEKNLMPVFEELLHKQSLINQDYCLNQSKTDLDSVILNFLVFNHSNARNRSGVHKLIESFVQNVRNTKHTKKLSRKIKASHKSSSETTRRFQLVALFPLIEREVKNLEDITDENAEAYGYKTSNTRIKKINQLYETKFD